MIVALHPHRRLSALPSRHRQRAICLCGAVAILALSAELSAAGPAEQPLPALILAAVDQRVAAVSAALPPSASLPDPAAGRGAELIPHDAVAPRHFVTRLGPRPVQLVAATRDAISPPAAVQRLLDLVDSDRKELATVDTYHQYSQTQTDVQAEWLVRVLGKKR